MRKIYEAPCVEIAKIRSESVIAVSGTGFAEGTFTFNEDGINIISNFKS